VRGMRALSALALGSSTVASGFAPPPAPRALPAAATAPGYRALRASGRGACALGASSSAAPMGLWEAPRRDAMVPMLRSEPEGAAERN